MRLLFAAKDHRRPLEPQTWEVVWCDQCRYGKIAAELVPEEVARFYQTGYYTHESGNQLAVSASLLDRIRLHIAWRCDAGIEFGPAELHSPGKLCDIGCGNGVFLQMFKEAGFQVVGIEPDDEARKLAGRFAPVYAGTVETLPDSLQSDFDYVLLKHVLEHAISPATALANARGLLKHNGVLVVEVPNNDALGFSMFAQFWRWTDLPRHIHFFTETSLCNAIKAAGFRISSIRFVGYSRQFGNDWIEDQQRIWAQIGEKTKAHLNFRRLAWWQLARTVISSKKRKYDSLRVHAVKI